MHEQYQYRKCMHACRTYKAASMMLRQVHFSRIDLELHSRFDPAGAETIFECDSRLAKETLPLSPLPEDRFLCGFAHIFAGVPLLLIPVTRLSLLHRSLNVQIYPFPPGPLVLQLHKYTEWN